ncbi:MAG: D-inositol-3-phosphate glycosyltransferase [bacterium]|nr:D-inositol-3-phosphate glycosyltransferase [bacterium]
MNIAYISADFGVHIFGHKGASIHVREMVSALRNAGHAVCLISPAIDEGKESKDASTTGAFSALLTERLPGVAFLPVLLPERHLQLFKEFEALDKFFGMKMRLRQEVRNLLFNQTLFDQARAYWQSRRLDWVYERYALFSYAGIRLAREFGVPHILEVNAPLAYEQEKMRGLELKDLARETEHHIFRHTDRVIVVSRELQEYVASCGVPAEHILLLPNAVDPQRFAAAGNPETLRARCGYNGKCVIGFVGSLKPWHGTETLLAAFREVHATRANTHLLIVGDGPGRAELAQYAQDHGFQEAVTFTGNVPHEDIPGYIAAMDVTVAPYKPYENFYYSPIKIFEYMIMGKPVVAGRIGQVEEVIVDGETGVLFEPGNIRQLAATLLQLTNDAPLCQRLGEKARAWVRQERTWENNAQQVIASAEKLRQKSKMQG